MEAVASRRWCCWPLLLSRAAGAEATVGLERIKYDSVTLFLLLLSLLPVVGGGGGAMEISFASPAREGLCSPGAGSVSTLAGVLVEE